MHRTVFMLRAVDEMSVEDVAAALEIPKAIIICTRFIRAKGFCRRLTPHFLVLSLSMGRAVTASSRT